MKKLIMLLLAITIVQYIACTSGEIQNVQNIPTLVKEGFISPNEYEIVCIGFAKEGLTGTQKNESAKRAAILNAYYYTGTRFNETVIPDKDGTIKKMEVTDTHATIYYVISKSNLKSRLKK
jgi:hypothetical protein